MVCITESENLCLYGHPHGEWEVILPAEEVPPELPEPALGINFARDGMQEKDWLSLIAVHSDTWLLAIAFYFGARFGFDKAKRFHSALFSFSISKFMLSNYCIISSLCLYPDACGFHRKCLFNMINELPTVYEIVSGASKKQQKEKSSVSNSSSKSKSNSKSVSQSDAYFLLACFSVRIEIPCFQKYFQPDL